MEKESLSINLLGDKNKKTSDILLAWAIYVGRLLVILTQVIALSVFLSRFSIDRQLIDLKDTIKKQQAIVEYFKQGEETYRENHLKLAVTRFNTASSSAVVDFFDELLNNSDRQITYTGINVTPSSLTVTAQASSVETLTNFTQKLKDNPKVASIIIEKVESKPKSALVGITIIATLKQKSNLK